MAETVKGFFPFFPFNPVSGFCVYNVNLLIAFAYTYPAPAEAKFLPAKERFILKTIGFLTLPAMLFLCRPTKNIS